MPSDHLRHSRRDRARSAAYFTHEVEATRQFELNGLVKQVRAFFKSFEGLNFKDLSSAHTQKLVDSHGLSISSLGADYGKKLKDLKS